MDEELKYANEEERVKALENLEEKPENMAQLERIRNAKIEEPAAAAGPETPPAAAPVEPPKPVEPLQKYEITDLKGHKKPEELLKSYDEKEALIQRQQTFIKELMKKQGQSSTSAVTDDVIKRAETAERELQELRSKSGASATPGTQVDIKAVQSEVSRIETLQAELDKQIEDDPDAAFTLDFQKKSRELSRMQTKNINLLTGLYAQASNEIREAKSATSEFLASSQRAREAEERSSVVEGVFKEMDELDVPDLKTSKPIKVLDAEYIKWRDDVSLAYYGEPVDDVNKKKYAMTQLELRNPDTIQKCKLLGVPTEPTPDIDRYIKKCELDDYRNGWRINPATGKYFDAPITVFDRATGKQVPFILPSLKAAVEQKRLDEGYYQKQADGAFQKGAQSIANAAGRRDQGAVTLNSGSDSGQIDTEVTQEAALRLLDNLDETAAMEAHRKGDDKMINEINKARRTIGLDPITFD